MSCVNIAYEKKASPRSGEACSEPCIYAPTYYQARRDERGSSQQSASLMKKSKGTSRSSEPQSKPLIRRSLLSSDWQADFLSFVSHNLITVEPRTVAWLPPAEESFYSYLLAQEGRAPVLQNLPDNAARCKTPELSLSRQMRF